MSFYTGSAKTGPPAKRNCRPEADSPGGETRVVANPQSIRDHSTSGGKIIKALRRR